MPFALLLLTISVINIVIWSVMTNILICRTYDFSCIYKFLKTM